MQYNIGLKIKELRKYWRMTQEELADNICSQAMISTIENDENVYTSALLLNALSQRLGVSIDYFFQETNVTNYSYVNEVCDQLTKLIQFKEYAQAYDMVKLEKKNPLFNKVIHLKQFLLWREAICINYLYDNKKLSLKLLEEALSYSETTSKNFSNRDIEIYISKAIMLNELSQFSEADLLYVKLINFCEKSPNIIKKSILINLYYNAARNADLLNDEKKALNFCENGINLCQKEQTMFLLGYLFYLKGQILYKKIGEYSEEVLKWYEEANWVFKKNGDFGNYKLILDKINTIKVACN
ncbi:hypothetical protein BKP35_12145 [Anaerobacillus arseniciselenatis]|uniref:HTH cro/C1-type domain-containing protein n=1 Tax=Anaerobacillus arseniciselenatis TaxID=85682 RepID=A0A1S2LIH4_9BACI|nr:helix-turn-helix domain-containing protein [Anaerobacillus arseniciselenatis]OIJ11487.1 hypothetical protein BKP35_12145 [Anaerobacillus arseniciselenatis]